jgi:LPXTG-motif cell wall-anchored protein
MHPAFRAIFAGLILGAPFAAEAGAGQPSCSLKVEAIDDTTMTLRYRSPDGIARTVWVDGHPYTVAAGNSVTTPLADTFDWPTVGNTVSVAEVLRICGDPRPTTTTTSSTVPATTTTTSSVPTTTTTSTAPPPTTTTAVSPTTITAPTTVVTATTPAPPSSIPPATSTSVELLPPVTTPATPDTPTTVGLPRLPETGVNSRGVLAIGGAVTFIGAVGAYAARRIEND